MDVRFPRFGQARPFAGPARAALARRPALVRVLLPVAWMVALYGVLAVAVARTLGVRLEPAAIPLDLGLHLAFAAFVGLLARRVWLAIVIVTAAAAVVTVGNALKIMILGAPIVPDDLDGAHALAMIAPRPLAIAMVAGLVAVCALLCASLTLRPRAALIAFVAVAGAFGLSAAAPGPLVATLDRAFGHSEWNQRENYERRGPLLYLAMESARHAARSTTPPTAAAVAAAASGLSRNLAVPAVLYGPPPSGAWRADAGRPDDRSGLGDDPLALIFADVEEAPALVASPRRNLHMIVLESFWDPTALVEAGIAEDPFDPRFRALWEAAGRSRALSPVFGGQTANAEFEALCGFPVVRQGVFFESGLRNAAPCLPRHLAERGYATVASHPNVAAFWNRTNAYRRLGFERYWSGGDFVRDDMVRDFLSDRSLYAQVDERIRPMLAAGTPLFNYVLTIYGHLDYPVDERRPEVVPVRTDDELVRRFVSTVHYKTVELMDHLDALRQRDPEAVIVVFGDHLPYLGTAYARSGVLAAHPGDNTAAMVLDRSATPLLVIDGRAGPVPVGDLPIFRIPSLVLDLLGDETPSVMDLTAPPEGVTVRPLPGRAVVAAAGGPELCQPEPARPSPACAAATAWAHDVELLATDLFSGRQHVLGLAPELLPAPRPSRPRWARLTTAPAE